MRSKYVLSWTLIFKTRETETSLNVLILKRCMFKSSGVKSHICNFLSNNYGGKYMVGWLVGFYVSREQVQMWRDTQPVNPGNRVMGCHCIIPLNFSSEVNISKIF